MERKNKIRVLRELRYLSGLAKTYCKCISNNKEIKLEDRVLKLRK